MKSTLWVAPRAGMNPTISSLGVGTAASGTPGDIQCSTLEASTSITSTGGVIRINGAGFQHLYFGATNTVQLGMAAGGNYLQVRSPNNTAGAYLFAVYDSAVTNAFAVVDQGLGNMGVATAPIASQAPTGGAPALNAAWQNTNAYDVQLQVVLSITANTSLVITAGVGPTNTPAAQTLITGVTLTGIVPLTFRVPAGYYLKINSSGTGTVAVMGSQQFN